VRVAVTSQGMDLEAKTSPVFGRCPAFVLVDSETMSAEGFTNPSVSAGGGAGIQAAQVVIGKGAQVVLSHNVGPNAFAVLKTAGIAVHRIGGGTVRQAVEAFLAGELPELDDANATAHNGVSGGGRN
jgi:predicted Fe-Mo cluster-binding NifX family protein